MKQHIIAGAVTVGLVIVGLVAYEHVVKPMIAKHTKAA